MRRAAIGAAVGLAMLASGLWAAAPSTAVSEQHVREPHHSVIPAQAGTQTAQTSVVAPRRHSFLVLDSGLRRDDDSDLSRLAQSSVPGDPQTTVLIAGQFTAWRERIDFDGVALTINGSAAALDREGRFTARVAPADYYQLSISGEKVFTAVQTFGANELRDPVCQCLKVPSIELVARKGGRIELFFGGDSMAGRRYLEPASGKPQTVRRETIAADLDQLFRPMQPYFVPSDLASVNLETVLADNKPGGSPNKLIVFYSPTALAGALKRAGIDYVSLGNNHTYDYLDAGLDLTEKSLNEAGVLHSGSGETIDAAAAAERVDLGSNRLSLLGFVGWAGYFKPNLVAGPDKGGAMHGSDRNIAAAVSGERAQRRAPIMQLHTGTEYADEPTEFGVKRMRLAIDEGAEMVASHHPHVTQGIELYKGKVIAYSIGNFLFDQNFVETMGSFALKVWMEKGKVIRAEVIPIQILDYRPVPAVGTIREAVLRRTFALSARRGTHFSMSGGHAVVRLDGEDRGLREGGDGPSCQIDATGILRRSFALVDPGRQCLMSAGGRFGRDLTMRGDFENAHYDVAQDRTWGARRASFDVRIEDSGNHHLALLPQLAGETAVLFTDPYYRVLSGTSYSVVADIKVSQALTLEAAIKDRQAAGQPATAAWKGGRPIGKIELAPAPGWQRVRFDFTRTPPVTGDPPPLRPILFATYKRGKAAGVPPVLLDNFAVIEWVDQPEASLPPGERWRWTHWEPARR